MPINHENIKIRRSKLTTASGWLSEPLLVQNKDVTGKPAGQIPELVQVHSNKEIHTHTYTRKQTHTHTQHLFHALHRGDARPPAGTSHPPTRAVALWLPIEAMLQQGGACEGGALLPMHHHLCEHLA